MCVAVQPTPANPCRLTVAQAAGQACSGLNSIIIIVAKNRVFMIVFVGETHLPLGVR
jgi:hypothetical protein